MIALKRNAIDENKEPAYIVDYDGEVWVVIRESEFLTENFQR